MMFNKLPIKPIIILLILGIVTLFVVSLLRKTGVIPPKLLSTNPANNSLNVGLYVTPTLRFDLPVSPSDLQIIPTPNISLSLASQSEYVVTLEHEVGFQPKTKYEFQIIWKGNPITTYSLTTQALQEDPALLSNMKKELERDYPLGQLTPYENNAYRVVYSSPLTLEITLKNDILSSEEALSQIKNWVQKNGLNPDTHKYTIVPANP